MAETLFKGVALVTGAGSGKFRTVLYLHGLLLTGLSCIGIGRQVAISFAQEGCGRIAILDRDEDGLSETSRLCKEQNRSVRTFIIPFDVRNEKDVEGAVDCVIEEWGRIDYAVNCAGKFRNTFALKSSN